MSFYSCDGCAAQLFRAFGAIATGVRYCPSARFGHDGSVAPNVCAPSNDCDGCAVLPPPVYDCDGCAVLALLPPLGRDGCASLALLPPLGCDGCAVLALLPHLVRGGCTNVRASARAPQTLSAREQRAANKEAGAAGVLCCVVQFTFFVLLCWSADLGRYSRCLIILLCLLWMMEQYRALSDVQIWLLQDCGNLYQTMASRWTSPTL